jgi:hypothetical protein
LGEDLHQIGPKPDHLGELTHAMKKICAVCRNCI